MTTLTGRILRSTLTGTLPPRRIDPVGLTAAPTNVIQFYRGDSHQVVVPVLDENGNLKNLTGATAVLTVKAFASAETELFHAAGVLSATPADGTITFSIVPANTADLAEESIFSYDVQVTIGTDVWTVVRGECRILEDVTR